MCINIYVTACMWPEFIVKQVASSALGGNWLMNTGQLQWYCNYCSYTPAHKDIVNVLDKQVMN